MSNNIEFKVLVSGSQDVEKAFGRLSEGLESFSKATKSVARDLSQVGQTISLFGASISGPLVLAFNNAAKSSAQAAEQTKRFQDITASFNREIASSLVPVFGRLNDVLSNLHAAFLRIDKTVRDQIFQGALLAGAFITVGGAITLLSGKMLGLVSNLASLGAAAANGVNALIAMVAANPIILGVTLAVGALLVLMFKFKEVGAAVVNTFEIMFTFLKNGFLTIGAFVKTFVANSFSSLSLLVNAVASIQSPLQEQYRALGQLLENNATLARRFAYEDLMAINENAAKIGEIIQTGEGQWALSFENMKNSVLGLGDTIQGLFDKTAQTFEGISVLEKKGLEISKKVNADKVASLSSTLQQAAQLNKNFANAYKTVAIGEAIMSTAAGVARAFKDYKFPISLAVAGLVAAAGAVQIATIAKQSFAVGTPKIPHDMTANVHRGEMIIPKKFSDAIRSGELSLSGDNRNGNGGGDGITININAPINGITDSLVEQIFIKASENIRNRTLAFGGV